MTFTCIIDDRTQGTIRQNFPMTEEIGENCQAANMVSVPSVAVLDILVAFDSPSPCAQSHPSSYLIDWLHPYNILTG